MINNHFSRSYIGLNYRQFFTVNWTISRARARPRNLISKCPGRGEVLYRSWRWSKVTQHISRVKESPGRSFARAKLGRWKDLICQSFLKNCLLLSWREFQVVSMHTRTCTNTSIETTLYTGENVSNFKQNCFFSLERAPGIPRLTKSCLQFIAGQERFRAFSSLFLMEIPKPTKRQVWPLWRDSTQAQSRKRPWCQYPLELILSQ